MFEPGFNDKIAWRAGAKDAFYNYIVDNPRRYLVKKIYPEYFYHKLLLTVGERKCGLYGNIFLLDNPVKSFVKLSRIKSRTPDLEQKIKEWEETLRCGGVLVSPFINPEEKVWRDEAIRNGNGIILIVDYRFSDRNSLSFHAGGGIAFPYGNSSMVPFEKRFYAGGANGVRGWSVRTLGPGAYDSHNSVTDFINQCGDISLILNLEYRNKLFWVFEGAVFIDAGNIWTIRNYPNQPGGFFRFKTFYKEIALAYGLGLRMDFNYFLLRFDMGVKAHNPAYGQERWPLLHPDWHRDFSFHFSVGYPF
jgi:hypothetical protein